MEPTVLQIAWFVLFGVLIAGYAVLDGFDLGVGVHSLFARSADDKATHIAAVAPVWGANEVWLLAGGGALFAAFPAVYASVFSGFYLAFMLLLVALIARGLAIELHHRIEAPRWHSLCAAVFGVASLMVALLVGVAVGNVMRGVPIDARGDYQGTFLSLLNPYALLIGVLSLVMQSTHGALYLAGKVDEALRRRVLARALPLWMAWVGLYVVATVATVFAAPGLFTGALGRPAVWGLFAALLAGLVAIPLAVKARRLGAALVASSVAVTSSVGLVGASLYPRLVPSSLDPAYSLTAANASSGALTLKVMLVIALVGMPAVIGYTTVIYRVFKGRVGHLAY